MGYQECYVHTNCADVKKNNEEIKQCIDIFKKYNVRCEDDNLASCVVKLHFNKDVDIYKKDMDVLVISGERSALRNPKALFNIDSEFSCPKYTQEELAIINHVKITYLENALDVVEEESNEDSIVVEECNLVSGLPYNYNNIKSMVSEILDKIANYLNENNSLDVNYIEELFYENKFNSMEDVLNIFSMIKEIIISNGYRFSYNQRRFPILFKKGIFFIEEFSLFINDIRFGKIKYYTLYDNYTLDLSNLQGKFLISLCEKLLNEKLLSKKKCV